MSLSLFLSHDRVAETDVTLLFSRPVTLEGGVVSFVQNEPENVSVERDEELDISWYL